MQAERIRETQTALLLALNLKIDQRTFSRLDNNVNALAGIREGEEIVQTPVVKQRPKSKPVKQGDRLAAFLFSRVGNKVAITGARKSR